MSEPRLCIVDDDADVLKSLGAFFEAHWITSVGYESAEAFLESEQLGEVSCLVLDLRMPGMSGLELLEKLSGENRLPATIVLSAHGDIPDAVRAMRLGATDFLTKPYDTRALLTSVQDAMSGEELRRVLRERLAEVEERMKTLSPREMDIFRGMVRGGSSREIAEELGLKPKSVEIYRSQVLSKFDLGSSVDLVRRVASVRPDLAVGPEPGEG